MPPGGVRVGGQQVKDEDQAIAEAVKLAEAVDIPILLVGLGSDYEYEASDREHLFLPGRVNEMISRVLESNPNTVCCTIRSQCGLADISSCRLLLLRRVCRFKCPGFHSHRPSSMPGLEAKKQDMLLLTFYLEMSTRRDDCR